MLPSAQLASDRFALELGARVDDRGGAADVAIIGAGYWGQNLVRVVLSLGRLRVVCDTDEAVRDRVASAHPGVKTTASLEEVLADPGVRAVMVIVPAVHHAAVARQALEAGKHVYVEKPLALSVEDGRALVDLADARSRQLMVGHLLLYHPCVRWAKAALDGGELGRALYLSSQRTNLGKVRTDENAMWSLAPHDVSVALYLLGTSPSEVAAHGFSYLQPERGIEDVVFLTLRFPGGEGAQIHVSWLDPHKKRALTIVGTRKMLTFDDVAATEKVRVYDKGVDRAEPATEAAEYASYGDLLTLRSGDILTPRIPMREPLRAQCEAFLEAIDTGTRPLADGRSGLEVLRVLAAGQRSLERGGRPIPLEEIS